MVTSSSHGTKEVGSSEQKTQAMALTSTSTCICCSSLAASALCLCSPDTLPASVLTSASSCRPPQSFQQSQSTEHCCILQEQSMHL